MNEIMYQLYKVTKKLIENTESCNQKNHHGEELFIEWKKAIVHLDAADRGFSERYETEKIAQKLIYALHEMCSLVDEFAKYKITPDTPLYNFQQGLISDVKSFREGKYDYSE